MQVIDTAAMAKAQNIDIAHPPMKTVPDEFWPRMVYKHPKEHYRKVVDRPSNAAPVERLVPNEPLILKVANEKELEKALKSGWRKEAFVPKPLDETASGIEYE